MPTVRGGEGRSLEDPGKGDAALHDRPERRVKLRQGNSNSSIAGVPVWAYSKALILPWMLAITHRVVVSVTR